MSENDQNLKKTPLYEQHLTSGAKMVPFAGWNMPIQYTGIIEEHLHARSKAGLFDICHMGEFFLRGPSSEKELDKLITCRLDNMPEGKCRYGFLLNESGGIIDDLIVFKISAEEFMLVVNSARVEADKAWIKKHISSTNTFTDESELIAKIDIQGPLSGKIVASLSENKNAQELKRFCFTNVNIRGTKILISRTGYTGESGYELFLPAQDAPKTWDALLSFDEVKPIGLGARDTLRMEMGYALYGNDIDEKHTPLEANLASFVFLEKDFIGKDALLREGSSDKLLTGFITEGRRSARGHFTVLSNNKPVGEVTSGSFSPCLKKGIGLCYIGRALAAEGTEIILTDGKTEIEARTKNVPIIR